MDQIKTYKVALFMQQNKRVKARARMRARETVTRLLAPWRQEF